MIEFNYETDFLLKDESHYQSWVSKIIDSENKSFSDICFVFCNDDYLLELNKTHLNHDTYTDIITFDYCLGDELCGDIFISVDRVRENAVLFNVSFENELHRVISHGILHLCGFKDKADEDVKLMRSKEDEKIEMF